MFLLGGMDIITAFLIVLGAQGIIIFIFMAIMPGGGVVKV